MIASDIWNYYERDVDLKTPQDTKTSLKCLCYKVCPRKCQATNNLYANRHHLPYKLPSPPLALSNPFVNPSHFILCFCFDSTCIEGQSVYTWSKLLPLEQSYFDQLNTWLRKPSTAISPRATYQSEALTFQQCEYFDMFPFSSCSCHDRFVWMLNTVSFHTVDSVNGLKRCPCLQHDF